MEQYMSQTRENYGSRVVRPKINDKTHFELKGHYLKKLRENTFSGDPRSSNALSFSHVLNWSRKSMALERTIRFNYKLGNPKNKVSEQEVILFYNGLDVLTIQILDFKGVIPTKTATDAKIVIQEMGEYSQKWHNGTSLKARRPHYTKDCPLKEEGNTLEEAYYTQFRAPYQPARQYRAARPRFYQRNNGNSLYPDRRQTLEESVTKFMNESAKRQEENSNIIKEIRASIDVAIRNQGASIKTLEIQIGQMSKVFKKEESEYRSIFSETVPFPRRLQNYSCDDWRKAQDVKILEAYDHTLPQKEKDPGSFTLPCFIYNVCFDKALVDL
ncbi:hypothetical protein Tco_1268853 [Tanacetum coccineum]